MVERVLVVGPKDTISMVDDLAPKGFEVVKALHNSPEMKAALPGTTYFVGFVQQYVTPQLFKDAPKLKLIQMLSAGYDRADLEAARKSRIPLCNNGGANSVAVSEHALLLMLSVSRRLITQHANVTAGRWHGNAPPTVHEVRNKVLGIIGLGTIGKKVARLAQAFGMVVHYYDIARLKEEQEDALGVRFRLLPEILRHSDIVSLHVPLNASTQRPDRRGRAGGDETVGHHRQHLARPGDRREGDDRGAVGRQAVRRRPRRVRRGADAARQSAAQARQRDPDGASRRPDLREQHHPPAQRLRQRRSAWRAASPRSGSCRELLE